MDSAADFEDLDDDLETGPVFGYVPLEGRGSAPYTLIHGESLVAAASFALEAAGIDLLDTAGSWQQLVDSGADLVVHDPLCPLTPPAFLARALAASRAQDAVVVGVRPVTDTIKEYDGSRIGETVPRESLAAVASPVVVPARLLADLGGFPDEPFDALVERLGEWQPLEAPALASRVNGPDDIRLLEALSAS